VPRLVDEFVPCLAAMVDDGVVGGEDTARQPVFAHELPDVLDRIEFGAFGGQRNDADVAGHLELGARVPSGLIHHKDRVRAGRDGERYLGKMQRHGFCIAAGQDEAGGLAVFRADRAEDIIPTRFGFDSRGVPKARKV